MDKTILIVAPSGRALAASARRGGFVPRVVDFFGDEDTLALAEAHRRLPDGLKVGMERGAVMDALAVLADGVEPLGVICGGGFEDRPELLAEIARTWPLLGNHADVVARVKDPVGFATLCRDAGIPHPEVSLQRPREDGDWLTKRRGGSGGSHISLEQRDRPERYFQRRVAGDPVSALILADGAGAGVLGFSEQWRSPVPSAPFRYGGAVTPATLAAETVDALTVSVQRLMNAAPLVGLNSVDFLVDGNAVWLLEINPRPGATLDIFEPAAGSLVALHVDACRGMLPAQIPPPGEARASAIVYAPADIARIPRFDWPDWVADRSHAGTPVSAGDPLCTVVARAATADAARRLLDRRIDTLLSCLGDARPPSGRAKRAA
jgi:predicted ATP-grasp superfamily ATP-dependent carboligase